MKIEFLLSLAPVLFSVGMLVYLWRDGKRQGRFGAEHYVYAFVIISIFLSIGVLSFLSLYLGGGPLPDVILLGFSLFFIPSLFISLILFLSISPLNKKLETRREKKERDAVMKSEIIEMIDEVVRDE